MKTIQMKYFRLNNERLEYYRKLAIDSKIQSKIEPLNAQLKTDTTASESPQINHHDTTSELSKLTMFYR